MQNLKRTLFGVSSFAVALLMPDHVASLEVISGGMPKAIDPSCTKTLTDGSTLSVYYNPTTKLINMEANLKGGSYAGWGWGASMVNTEMVVFSADGNKSTVKNYYSTK